MWWAVAKFVAVLVASYVINAALAPKQKKLHAGSGHRG